MKRNKLVGKVFYRFEDPFVGRWYDPSLMFSKQTNNKNDGLGFTNHFTTLIVKYSSVIYFGKDLEMRFPSKPSLPVSASSQNDNNARTR